MDADDYAYRRPNYVGRLHLLEKVPQIHNYIWLTEENVQRQYRNSQLFLNVLKNIILFFFSYMTYESVRLLLVKSP